MNNSKQVVQDILPPSERSIRKIPLPPKRIPIYQNEEVIKEPREIEEEVMPRAPKKRKTRLILWVLGFILLLFVLWSFTVNGALIKVTVKEATHDFEGTLTASKTDTPAAIPFEVINV